MENNHLPTLVEAQLKGLSIPKELSASRVNEIKLAFVPFLKAVIEAQELVDSVEVKNVNDKEGIEYANKVYKIFKDSRVNAKKEKDAQKKAALEEGKFIQAIYNKIEEVSQAQEEILYPKAKIVEIAKKRKQERLEQLRRDKVVGLEAFFPMSIDFIKTTEEDFNKMYDQALRQKEAAEKAAKEREEAQALEAKKAAEEMALEQAKASANKLHEEINPEQGTGTRGFHSPAMTAAAQDNNIPSVTLNEQADLQKLLKVFENVLNHLEKNTMVSSPIGHELKDRAIKENQELISIINSKL